MDAEDFAVDDRAKGHEVKDLTACLPDGCVAVFLDAFLVEAVDLGDLSGFVVAADEGHAVWVSRTTRPVNMRFWAESAEGAYFAFRQSSSVRVSRLKYPRST